MAVTLSDYLASTRRHLKDATGQYWSDTSLIPYINEGRQHVCIDGGALRALITLILTASQDTYSLQAPVLPAAPAGTTGYAQILGLYGINLISSGSAAGTRIRLKNPPYSVLVANYKRWTTAVGIPEAWSTYGAQSVIFGPIPSLAYFTEWDAKLLAAPLVATTDGDVLVFPFTEPVPYYAAYLAKMEQQQYQEAAKFYNPDPAAMGLYQQRLLEAIASTPDTIPDIYGTDGERPWGWT